MPSSNSMRISRPSTPKSNDAEMTTHDAAMIVHEHIPELFSPQYTNPAEQPYNTSYYNPNPLGLEEEGVPLPSSSRIEIQDAPAPRLRVEYNVEGGWQPDGFGGHYYQEYGRIEDVSDSNCHVKNSKSNSEGHPFAHEDYDGPCTITSPLPPSTTPPPAPTFRDRRFEILPDSDCMGSLFSSPDQNLRTMPYPRPSSLEPSRAGSPPVDQPPTSHTPSRNINTSLQNPHLHRCPTCGNPLSYSSRNPGHDGTPSVDRPPSRAGSPPVDQPPMSNTPPPRNINTSLPNPHLHHPLLYSSRNPGHNGTPPVDRPPSRAGYSPVDQPPMSSTPPPRNINTSLPNPHFHHPLFYSSRNPGHDGTPPADRPPSRAGYPPVDQPPMSSTPPPRNINTSLPNLHLHHPLFYSSRNPGHDGTPPVDQPPTPLGNIPASQNMNRHSFEVHSPVRERPTRPLPLSPLHFNRQLDANHELTVLQSHLRLINAAAGRVDAISWMFQDVRNPEDIRPQLAVDVCGRIKATLSALTATLGRRNRFTEEHWKLQSQAWGQKYCDRHLSLRRTLQRLHELEDRLGGTRSKLKVINKALEKLRQFDHKLSDLNSGFNKLFDRLRTRQLHAMLTDSISEEEQRRKSHFSSIEAYKIKRTEGKAARAHLRRDLLVYRTGRRLSLVT